jgi:hypothetical protein
MRLHGMPKPIRVTVDEASNRLEISANALRKRAERGTVRSEKFNGIRYVLLSDSDMPQHAEDTSSEMPHDSAAMSNDSATGMSAFVESLEDQVDYLRRQLEVWQEEARHKDHIIAALPSAFQSRSPRERLPQTNENPRRHPLSSRGVVVRPTRTKEARSSLPCGDAFFSGNSATRRSGTSRPLTRSTAQRTGGETG